MHRLRLVDAITQMSREELSCLARHGRDRRVAIEIGTFMGVSAATIARGLAAEGVVYCVDPYDGGEALRRIALRHLARSGVMKRVVLVRDYSRSAGPLLPVKADFMFVDGDHSFEGLRTDWELVQERLAPGGVVCFHDTSNPPGWAGEYCGAVEFFAQAIRHAQGYEHLETCHSLNVMRRNA